MYTMVLQDMCRCSWLYSIWWLNLLVCFFPILSGHVTSSIVNITRGPEMIGLSLL